MYGGEVTHQILKYLREGKKHVEIAELVHRHPNTITAHVKWLRSNQLYGDKETLNKIDDRLKDEINSMPTHLLLSWRSQLVPKRLETKEEITMKKEIPLVDFRNISPEEREEINKITKRLLASRGEE